jgi:hypothetical protein
MVMAFTVMACCTAITVTEALLASVEGLQVVAPLAPPLPSRQVNTNAKRLAALTITADGSESRI